MRMQQQQRSEALLQQQPQLYQGGAPPVPAAGTSPMRMMRSESPQVQQAQPQAQAQAQVPAAAAYVPAPVPARVAPPRPSDGEVLQVVRQLPVEAFRMCVGASARARICRAPLLTLTRYAHSPPPRRLRNKGALTRTGGFVQAVALSEEEEDLVGSSALLAKLVRLGVVGAQQQAAYGYGRAM
jgi:hypothetical protein